MTVEFVPYTRSDSACLGSFSFLRMNSTIAGFIDLQAT
jgi:hypothetical protein